MGRTATYLEKKVFIRQKARQIEEVFRDAGGIISTNHARQVVGIILNSAEETHKSTINATVRVADGGVQVGVTAVENVIADKTKDNLTNK